MVSKSDPMSVEVAIENLYKTFSKYPFKSTMEGCPCCVSDTDKSTLHSKQLRKLEDEDISRYAFKAMTTWGDVDDFKHYLPRVFELSATRQLTVDTFVILRKLEYANWQNWEKGEWQAVTHFLNAWWKHDITTNDQFDDELFIEIYKLLDNLPELLRNWNLEYNQQGFINYVNFIRENYHDLGSKISKLEELTVKDVGTLKTWINEQRELLETGFFKAEETDKEFSNVISDTLYMLERTS